MPTFIERTIEREIDSINDHLPQKKIALLEVLGQERPGYTTKNGEYSAFKREEIKYLAKEIPTQYHRDIDLPIVILRRMDLGKGIHTISGTNPVLFLMHRILGNVDLGWADCSQFKVDNIFARPQVQVIRKKLPTTTCIGFVTTLMKKNDRAW